MQSKRALSDRARHCAANNADLYQSVFRAHGLTDHRNDACWWTEASPPPYYSNLTTLDPDAIEVQTSAIERLCAASPRPFSVKDGFSRLDLAPLRFRILFEAQWIWLDAHLKAGDEQAKLAARWTRIRDAGLLEAWEKAWSVGSPSEQRMFPPAILDDPDIAIFGREAGNGFDAGCIANRSERGIGLSNVFSTSEMTRDLYRQAVDAAFDFADDRPLVGYEQGEMLQISRSVGFESVGPLRVWLREQDA